MADLASLLLVGIVKSLCQVLVLGVTAGLGILVYFLTGRSLGAALVASWCTLASCAAGVVWLTAEAFRRFDVVRDTPP